jgi:hypothetical protein
MPSIIIIFLNLNCSFLDYASGTVVVLLILEGRYVDLYMLILKYIFFLKILEDLEKITSLIIAIIDRFCIIFPQPPAIKIRSIN